jgi:hypothetical protein
MTDLRPSEDDGQNGFLEELTVGPQLDPRALLELAQDLAQSFFCALPGEVWASAEGRYQPGRQERGKRRARGKAKGARETIRKARRSA